MAQMNPDLISEAERKELKALLVEKFPDVPVRVTFQKTYGETAKVRVHILQDHPHVGMFWCADRDKQYLAISQVVCDWHAACDFTARVPTSYSNPVKYYVTYVGKEAKKNLSLADIVALIDQYNSENGFTISKPVIDRFGHTKRSTKSFGIIAEDGKTMTVIEVDGNAAFCKTVSVALADGNDIKSALLDERVPRYGTLVYPLQ